jgi:hypothetical protein
MRGNELSDCCQKKKNVEENHEEMNKTTEVACVAREVDDNENENLAQIGTCVICGKTSMAFMYCEDCGKDCGAICIPTQESNEDSIYEQSTTDSGNTANINVKYSPDYSTTKTEQYDSDEEVDLCSIDKLDGVFILRMCSPKFLLPISLQKYMMRINGKISNNVKKIILLQMLMIWNFSTTIVYQRSCKIFVISILIQDYATNITWNY